MAIGPRLDLRQSQTLVMTPQLRQAIKLLQFSNIEVAAFVEEELERNPLLERDDSIEALPERPALDQRAAPSDPTGATGFEDAPPPPDTADAAMSGSLAETNTEPLDADYTQ